MTEDLGELRTGKKKGRPFGQSDVLTIDELKRIVAIPDRRTKEGARDYALLLIFANTPARQGEIIQLNTEHLISEGDKKFIIRQGLKKRGTRPYWIKTPISTEVFEGVKRYIDFDRERTPSSPLFRTLGKYGPYASRRITQTAIALVVQKYADAAGIKKRITPHSFRATFPTLRKHHDPWTLQQLGGWASVNGVMPYVREEKKKVEDAALEFQFA